MRIKAIKVNENDVRNGFVGRETELVVLCDMQTYYDLDDNECEETSAKIVTAKEAIEEFLSGNPWFVLFSDGTYYSRGSGGLVEHYMAIYPIAHGVTISNCDIRTICDYEEEEELQ